MKRRFSKSYCDFSEINLNKILKAFAYIYILECSDGSFYTGSTTDIYLRMIQHKNGEGSNYTKDHLPVRLIYYEAFDRIDEAFKREKQIQGWSRKKKIALIQRDISLLRKLSASKNR